MIQHGVLFAAHHEREASQIRKHGPGAILSIEPQQGTLLRELVPSRVATDGREGLAQFRPVKPVASVAKRTEPLVAVGLAGPAGSEGVSASCGSGWLRRCRSGHLLPRSGDWPDGASSSRWKRSVASLPFGTRTRWSSCFPFPSLVGQEMALDDSLQSILQEALAAPRRAEARRGRQSPTAASLGGGSLISSFILLTLCFFLSAVSAFPGSTSAVSMSLLRL
jgi:hypothetical protein